VVSRITISSTALWRPFRRHNRGRSWAGQIKPFNFLMVATIDQFGYPPGVNQNEFRLVAAYNDNPDTWTDLEWRNIYDPDGPSYRRPPTEQQPQKQTWSLSKAMRMFCANTGCTPNSSSTGRTDSRVGETPADSSNAAQSTSRVRCGSSVKKQQHRRSTSRPPCTTRRDHHGIPQPC
jgi:hypothetical protein